MLNTIWIYGVFLFLSISAAAEPLAFWEEAFPEEAISGTHSGLAGFIGTMEIGIGGRFAQLAPQDLKRIETQLRDKIESLASVASSPMERYATNLERHVRELREAKADLLDLRSAFYRANSPEFGPALHRGLGSGEYEATIARLNRDLTRLEQLEPELVWQATRARSQSHQTYETHLRRISQRENLSTIEAKELARANRARRGLLLRTLFNVYLIGDGAARIYAAAHGRSPGLAPGIQITSTAIKRGLRGPVDSTISPVLEQIPAR